MCIVNRNRKKTNIGIGISRPWRSGAEYVTSRAQRLSTIFNPLWVSGEEIFCFFETWRPECGSNPRSPTFKAGSFSHCIRVPARRAYKQYDCVKGALPITTPIKKKTHLVITISRVVATILLRSSREPPQRSSWKTTHKRKWAVSSCGGRAILGQNNDAASQNISESNCVIRLWSLNRCLARDSSDTGTVSMLAKYWVSVCDAGQILSQHWDRISYLLGT